MKTVMNPLEQLNREILFTLTEEQFSQLSTTLKDTPSDVVSSKFLDYPQSGIEPSTFYKILQFIIHPHEVQYSSLRSEQVGQFSTDLEITTSFEQIVALAEVEFTKQDIKHKEVFSRLKQLKQISTEEDTDFSLDSLKGLLFFLFVLALFDKPQITANDLGILQTGWRKSRYEAMTVSFKNLYTLNYVIFRPSRHTSKRTILNGAMNTLDFIDYITELQIQIHQTLD